MTKNIAIIGAGCSGTVAAIELIGKNLNIDILLIDDSISSHRGLAYSTKVSAHLLNVPAGKMSIRSEDPNHFVNWLNANGEMVNNNSFVKRSSFGNYLEHTFEAFKNKTNSKISLIKSKAVTILKKANNFIIELDNQKTFEADMIILATGWSGAAVNGSENKRIFIPYSIKIPLPTGNQAAIIGTGLSAIDAVLTLRQAGFTGKISMYSRRGLRPNPHLLGDQIETDLKENQSLRKLFRTMRKAYFKRQANGLSWQGLVDSIRPKSQMIWQGFSCQEKSRFLRHLRPYWDCHRHRLPNEISKIIDTEMQSGRLSITAAKIINISEKKSSVDLKIRLRGSKQESTETVDFIINATGANVIDSNYLPPLFNSLVEQDLLCIDSFKLGAECNINGQLLNKSGQVISNLYAIGPLTRASLWESTAVPEIVQQAKKIVEKVTV